MALYPTSPLIIITNGSLYGHDISGSTASARDIDNPRGGYYLLNGPRTGWLINPILNIGNIASWEESTAVQDSTLERVCDAFQGSELTEEQDTSIALLKAYTY